MCFWPSAWVPYHLIQAPEHKKPDQRAIRGCCWFSFAKSGTWAYWTRAAEIVRIELHAQPYCVTTTGFHNKVSTVPESPWPKLDVEQKFEIQIQNFNRFFCNRFWNDLFVQNVVRKHLKIENVQNKKIGPKPTKFLVHMREDENWKWNAVTTLCFAKWRLLFIDFAYKQSHLNSLWRVPRVARSKMIGSWNKKSCTATKL